MLSCSCLGTLQFLWYITFFQYIYSRSTKNQHVHCSSLDDWDWYTFSEACTGFHGFQATHTVQAVRAYAPGARRSQSCPPGWHEHSHRRSTWSWKTPLRQQFPIRNPKTEAQVWWAMFLVRWDRRRGTHFLPISKNLTNTDTFKKQLKIYSPPWKFRFSSIENLIEVVILIH